MIVWYDGVIWSRQAMGGVNRYFARIIDGLPPDVEPVLTVERRREVNFPVNPRMRVIDCPRGGSGTIGWVDCDVVHPTYFELLSHGDISRLKAPVVLTVHDALHELYPELADPDGVQAAWKKKLIPVVNHLICVSHNTKKDVMKIFGVPEERISVVHHASDLHAGMADGLRRPCPEQYFLYVGHRYCYKNVPRLLEAFAQVRVAHPGVKLYFTGAPFNDGEKERLGRMGLAGAAIHAGYVSDRELAALYRHAAALVYPSLYEGFGIPLLEAMACGCPVIASGTSSVPEVAGDAALLVDPLDTGAWTSAMTRILEEEGLRERFVERGLERAGLFTWERSVAETVAVYRSLVGGRERR